jgi:hypothetical protein
MPARTSVAQRFEMFDHTVAGMEERLFKARAPAEMMSALRWGLDEMDKTYAETPPGVLAKVACRSGCASCCHVPVDVQAHHSSDAALCAANQADASVNVTKAYLPALRARMFAVMMGLDEALEACGYDERCYDFGSALHESLTNSRCLMRWLRRLPAFPDNCLAGGG